MTEPIEGRVQRLESKTDQLSAIVTEIHSLSREVRDLAMRVTQYIERHDNLTTSMDKAEQRTEKLAERLEAVEKTQASQTPVISMVGNIGGKIIWACIAFALASGSAMAVLGYLLKSQPPGV
jgi:predicted RNase H-like nuclease (RuvC/YqgF family)